MMTLTEAIEKADKIQVRAQVHVCGRVIEVSGEITATVAHQIAAVCPGDQTGSSAWGTVVGDGWELKRRQRDDAVVLMFLAPYLEEVAAAQGARVMYAADPRDGLLVLYAPTAEKPG